MMKALPYSISVLLTVGFLTASNPAQVKTIAGRLERASAIFAWLEPAPVAITFIQHGVPPWRSEYEAVLGGSKKGENVRLGKDFWTTLHTSIPLHVGGTRVPAGTWYLNLFCDTKGDFHLTLMESGRADARGYMPFTPAVWCPELKTPLTHEKTENSVQRLTITFARDGKDVHRSKLQLAWGKHSMTVPVSVEKADLEEARVKTARPEDRKGER